MTLHSAVHFMRDYARCLAHFSMFNQRSLRVSTATGMHERPNKIYCKKLNPFVVESIKRWSLSWFLLQSQRATVNELTKVKNSNSDTLVACGSIQLRLHFIWIARSYLHKHVHVDAWAALSMRLFIACVHFRRAHSIMIRIIYCPDIMMKNKLIERTASIVRMKCGEPCSKSYVCSLSLRLCSIQSNSFLIKISWRELTSTTTRWLRF